MGSRFSSILGRSSENRVRFVTSPDQIDEHEHTPTARIRRELVLGSVGRTKTVFALREPPWRTKSRLGWQGRLATDSTGPVSPWRVRPRGGVAISSPTTPTS